MDQHVSLHKDGVYIAIGVSHILQEGVKEGGGWVEFVGAQVSTQREERVAGEIGRRPRGCEVQVDVIENGKPQGVG